jgi:hypothetical protein
MPSEFAPVPFFSTLAVVPVTIINQIRVIGSFAMRSEFAPVLFFSTLAVVPVTIIHQMRLPKSRRLHLASYLLKRGYTLGPCLHSNIMMRLISSRPTECYTSYRDQQVGKCCLSSHDFPSQRQTECTLLQSWC